MTGTRPKTVLRLHAFVAVALAVSAVALGANAAVSMRLVQACHWGNP